MAFLFGREERMDESVDGMLVKSVTMLFAGGIGFWASNTWVVTFRRGVMETVTSFTGTPLQSTPAGHLTHGLVPVIFPVLM